MRAALVALGLLAGCKEVSKAIERVQGNGTPKVEQRQVDAFQHVELGGALRAEVTVGAAQQSVEITGDENLVPLITTNVKEQRLWIETTKSLQPKLDLVARIASPTLKSVAASGANKVHVYGVAGDTFELSVAGHARIDASGTTKKLVISVSGSAEIHADQLAAEDVTVHVSGSGTLDVKASGLLDVHITGSGLVRYTGTPREIKKSIAGAGKLVDAAALAPPKLTP